MNHLLLVPLRKMSLKPVYNFSIYFANKQTGTPWQRTGKELAPHCCSSLRPPARPPTDPSLLVAPCPFLSSLLQLCLSGRKRSRTEVRTLFHSFIYNSRSAARYRVEALSESEPPCVLEAGGCRCWRAEGSALKRETGRFSHFPRHVQNERARHR